MAAEEAGIRFGQYVLFRRIARGGMAEVFLAQQRGLEGFDRRVAVKRILPHLADSPEFLKMFLSEARLAAQLTHPNIVHIYDFGKVDTDYFIAMEYVDGVHAGQLIRYGDTTDRPSATMIARIGADAAAALHYAHELRGPAGAQLGLVHRDVSPANLMISFDGVLKLCDFGIAKAAAIGDRMTNPGQVKGKYAYMSPEQTIGAPLDGRSDVFSLAIVLWELVVGDTMVPRGDVVAAMRAIRDGKLPSLHSVAPKTPEGLANAITWALQTRRDHRPTAMQLTNALEAFIKSSPELATPMQAASWLRARFTNELTSDPLLGAHSLRMSSRGIGSGSGGEPTTSGSVAVPPLSAGRFAAVGGSAPSLITGDTTSEQLTIDPEAFEAAHKEASMRPRTASAPQLPRPRTESSGPVLRPKTESSGPVARPAGESSKPPRPGTESSGLVPRPMPKPPGESAGPPRPRTDSASGPIPRPSTSGGAGRSPGGPGGRPRSPTANPVRAPNATTLMTDDPGAPAHGPPTLPPMLDPGPLGIPPPPAATPTHAAAAKPGVMVSNTMMENAETIIRASAYRLPVPTGPGPNIGPNPSPNLPRPGGPHARPSALPGAMQPAMHGVSGPMPGAMPIATHGSPGRGAATLALPASALPDSRNALHPPPAMPSVLRRKRARFAVLAIIAVAAVPVVISLTSSSDLNRTTPPDSTLPAVTPIEPSDAAPVDAAAIDAAAIDAAAIDAIAPVTPDTAATTEPASTSPADATAPTASEGDAARLEVRTQPDGATIKVAGRARTSPAQLTLPAGRYIIDAELEGWEPERRTVELTKGQRVVQDIVFSSKHTRARAKKLGKLIVRTTPPSEVFLGTRRLSATPLEISFEPGTYTFLFKHPQRANVTKNVTITAGKTTKLTFSLP